MDESGLPSVLVLVILLAGNVYLALGHAALTNASKIDLQRQADRGHRPAVLALRLSEEATNLLTTFQFSQIVLRFLSAGVAAVGIAPPLALWFAGLGMNGGWAFTLAEVLVLLFGAVLMLTVGGQIPAAIGAAYADRLALAFARPIGVLTRILMPFSWTLRALSGRVVSLLGAEVLVHYVTEEEIKTLVDAGQEEGTIEDEAKKMIYSIFNLDDTAVREVMVPRLDLVALRIDAPLDEAVQTVLAAGHSRIPVYEDNIDHIRGLLYAKDLLKLWGEGGNGAAVRRLLREAYFVPEGKSAMVLLREMQASRVHLAIVIDEYGGTAGLVTLEDLIEEIIGEVRDEYDEHEVIPYRQVSEDEYICEARLDLDDLNDLMDLNLPTDESDTLGGYIFTLVGDV
ncbi:MAG: HlyC/CorC family transporter, partial [Anaerolineae bacterium]|nr:HlyC/CorC family transporter [Anaerolineae bacterium]